MQPYLRLCHVWGEVECLMNLYSVSDGEGRCLTSDSAPSDLSPTLPFLTGVEWNLITERVANFGDQQCNKLLVGTLTYSPFALVFSKILFGNNFMLR